MAGYLVIVMTVYLTKMIKWKAAFISILPRHAARTLLEFVTRGNARQEPYEGSRGRMGGSLTCG